MSSDIVGIIKDIVFTAFTDVELKSDFPTHILIVQELI